MTSHHDVAGVVAELRDASSGWSGDAVCISAEAGERAASFIESQAKALNEAEDKNEQLQRTLLSEQKLAYGLSVELRKFRDCALAAETRLAEAMRVIERCEDALSRCYQVTEWPADGTTSQDEALTAARAFTNAAKDANNG